ncbi:MAG: hypothetical protein WBC70_14600 [Candidatus Aminicenantales bacterium]
MKEPKEVKIYYEKGKMIFSIGDREYFLTEETAGKIFGRSVGLEFERTRDQDDTFGGLRTLENYVRIRRLLTKGLGMDKVAKALGVPEAQVRQFYSAEVARPHLETWDANMIENERGRQAAEEMDFCREIPRPQALNEQEAPEPGERFVDLRDIRNLRLQGKSDERIAGALGLDKKEFGKFLDLNRRYLDLLQ